MMSDIMECHSSGDEHIYLSVTGGPYRLKVPEYFDQIRHKGLEVWEGLTIELFVLVSGSETIYLLVWSVSHSYVSYLMAEKKKRADFLHLEDVNISVFSVFVQLGYQQHRICPWSGPPRR